MTETTQECETNKLNTPMIRLRDCNEMYEQEF